jgi:hypothetical protein
MRQYEPLYVMHPMPKGLSVYGCISDTFMLSHLISTISLCISLLYLHLHFVPKIIWISGIRAGCC